VPAQHFGVAAPVLRAPIMLRMEHSFVSALVLLLLVLDPFGSLPIFISVLRGVAPERRPRIALREVLIAPD
jgi:small neutral amino acid transporter SnatA (MarC family)